MLAHALFIQQCWRHLNAMRILNAKACILAGYRILGRKHSLPFYYFWESTVCRKHGQFAHMVADVLLSQLQLFCIIVYIFAFKGTSTQLPNKDTGTYS